MAQTVLSSISLGQYLDSIKSQSQSSKFDESLEKFVHNHRVAVAAFLDLKTTPVGLAVHSLICVKMAVDVT